MFFPFFANIRPLNAFRQPNHFYFVKRNSHCPTGRQLDGPRDCQDAVRGWPICLFPKWRPILKDLKTTAAAIDRLVHRARREVMESTQYQAERDRQLAMIQTLY